MSVSKTQPSIVSMIENFGSAAPGRLQEEYERLVASVWSNGTATDLALAAVPQLIAGLGQADAGRRPHLAVLLGLLAEAAHPGANGELAAAVGEGVDQYLDLLRENRAEPLALALLYLLSHFPGDRDRILDVAGELAFEAGEVTRLERALRLLDPDEPDLGRVWPAPSVWTLNETEREFDRQGIAALSADQVTTNWNNDTQTVLGYSGAKAYWAARNGAPSPDSGLPPSADVLQAADATDARPGPVVDASSFLRHLSALRCPRCHGPLESHADDIRCAACALLYPVANGILNLSGPVNASAAGAKDAATADLLAKLAEMPSMGRYYEAVLRPAFLRVSGMNWDTYITPAVEDVYIAEHLRPTDGPVLDLAAGAGRWTRTVANMVGEDRLIALDAGLPMLNTLRARLPGVPAMLSSALDLPFVDASLGAVNCWNALQAFPEDAARAIAEVGRCLRPGGTFTLMTFRFAADPIYRYFQSAHHFPSRPEGMLLFEIDEVRSWLADAGLTVQAEWAPASFLFITARKWD